jgi:hypothetical protein
MGGKSKDLDRSRCAEGYLSMLENCDLCWINQQWEGQNPRGIDGRETMDVVPKWGAGFTKTKSY